MSQRYDEPQAPLLPITTGTGERVEVDLEADRALSSRFLGLSVGSLVLAGSLSLLLVVGRMPPFSWLVTDPGFFKRCLVVHVNLALLVWFYAFVAALFSLLPATRKAPPLARSGPFVALVGVACLLITTTFPEARPILANYVPLLDHELYVVGLGLIGAGVAFSLLSPRLFPATIDVPTAMPLPAAAEVGIRSSGLTILFALVTFAMSQLTAPPGLSPDAHFELVMWGGGHVLQIASVSAMLGVWASLLSAETGREVISRGAASLVQGWLLLPVMIAPLLAMRGSGTADYHVGFTRMMQFGIAPPVLVYLALCLRGARRQGVSLLGSAGGLSFSASALLTVLGFVIGATIRGPDTRVPAHYHASIGAVTVAFMALAPRLLSALGRGELPERLVRAARLQPALLGVGQAIFAIGFGWAGASGMARKVYGSEQHIRSLSEWAGLFVMGAGGMLAVVGGVLFLVIIGAMVRRKARGAANEEGGSAWQTLVKRTRSNA